MILRRRRACAPDGGTLKAAADVLAELLRCRDVLVGNEPELHYNTVLSDCLVRTHLGRLDREGRLWLLKGQIFDVIANKVVLESAMVHPKQGGPSNRDGTSFRWQIPSNDEFIKRADILMRD
jgi:hypothetical protein